MVKSSSEQVNRDTHRYSWKLHIVMDKTIYKCLRNSLSQTVANIKKYVCLIKCISGSMFVLSILI